MSTDNELVDRIVMSIENNQDYTLCVQESWRNVLKACVTSTHGRDPMLLGLKGLPKDSAQLVGMGVFYIDGEYLCVHRAIYSAIQEKDRKFDDFLERLKR